MRTPLVGVREGVLAVRDKSLARDGRSDDRQTSRVKIQRSCGPVKNKIGIAIMGTVSEHNLSIPRRWSEDGRTAWENSSASYLFSGLSSQMLYREKGALP